MLSYAVLCYYAVSYCAVLLFCCWLVVVSGWVAGCECCGISAWYRESSLESLDHILLAAAATQQEKQQEQEEEQQGQAKSQSQMQVQVLEQVLQQGEPLAPRGLCQPCVDMLRSGKGYCSVCYRKYIDDTPLYAPPPSRSRSISKSSQSSSQSAGVREEQAQAQQQQVAMSMGVAVAEEAQQMVCCDECNEWVHSKCEGIDRGQYESIANGTHPVWVSE